MVVGPGSLGGQDLISGMLPAKPPKIAKWSSIIAGLLYWTQGLIPVLLGIYSSKLLPNLQEGNRF